MAKHIHQGLGRGASLAGQALALSPQQRQALGYRMAEEDAAMRLAATCGPRLLEAAVGEARRRAEVFAERQLTGLHSLPDGYTPLRAGLESVTRDVATGLFV
jgi:hypothetical protein